MAVRKKVDTGRYSKFLIYLVVIVLLNIAGITLFFRLDLTSNKIYSLSEASRKVVSTLSEPLTVKVFFNSNLPAPYNNVERYLHGTINRFEQREQHGRFTVYHATVIYWCRCCNGWIEYVFMEEVTNGRLL